MQNFHLDEFAQRIATKHNISIEAVASILKEGMELAECPENQEGIRTELMALIYSSK